MGPSHVPGQKADFFVDKTIQRVYLAMGRKMENMDDVPCGTIVCLEGIDKFLVSTGTITTCTAAHKFKSVKPSVSPLVRVFVRPKARSCFF